MRRRASVERGRHFRFRRPQLAGHAHRLQRAGRLMGGESPTRSLQLARPRRSQSICHGRRKFSQKSYLLARGRAARQPDWPINLSRLICSSQLRNFCPAHCWRLWEPDYPSQELSSSGWPKCGAARLPPPPLKSNAPPSAHHSSSLYSQLAARLRIGSRVLAAAALVELRAPAPSDFCDLTICIPNIARSLALRVM